MGVHRIHQFFELLEARTLHIRFDSEIVAEKEKKKEEDGEKKAKATHAGWNNNHAEMKLHFGKLSAVCHLLTEATKTFPAPRHPPPTRSASEKTYYSSFAEIKSAFNPVLPRNVRAAETKARS